MITKNKVIHGVTPPHIMHSEKWLIARQDEVITVSVLALKALLKLCLLHVQNEINCSSHRDEENVSTRELSVHRLCDVG